ncbi:hypothetical protein OF83DRAFT_1206692 [Amylostereum chailletii]|nr:hypothetical protein OF83DRAFT_1206692 [Amylostereum chailletii]
MPIARNTDTRRPHGNTRHPWHPLTALSPPSADGILTSCHLNAPALYLHHSDARSSIASNACGFVITDARGPVDLAGAINKDPQVPRKACPSYSRPWTSKGTWLGQVPCYLELGALGDLPKGPKVLSKSGTRPSKVKRLGLKTITPSMVAYAVVQLRMFLCPMTKWDPPKVGGYNSYELYDYVMDLLDPNDPFTISYLVWLNSAIKFPTEDLSRKWKTPPSSTDSGDNASDVHAIKAHRLEHLQLASTMAPAPLPAEATVGVSATAPPIAVSARGTPVASMDVDVVVQDMPASTISKSKPKPTTKSKPKPTTKSKPKLPKSKPKLLAKDANRIGSVKTAPTTKKAAPMMKKAKAALTRIAARNKTGKHSRIPLMRNIY